MGRYLRLDKEVPGKIAATLADSGLHSNTNCLTFLRTDVQQLIMDHHIFHGFKSVCLQTISPLSECGA